LSDIAVGVGDGAQAILSIVAILATAAQRRIGIGAAIETVVYLPRAITATIGHSGKIAVGVVVVMGDLAGRITADEVHNPAKLIEVAGNAVLQGAVTGFNHFTRTIARGIQGVLDPRAGTVFDSGEAPCSVVLIGNFNSSVPLLFPFISSGSEQIYSDPVPFRSFGL